MASKKGYTMRMHTSLIRVLKNVIPVLDNKEELDAYKTSVKQTPFN
jgi:hypothetical protein